MNRNSPPTAEFTRYFFNLLFVTVLVIASNTSLSYAQTTESQDKLERAQIRATKQVRKMANTVDNFFSTERHYWNDNPSRLTLQGNFDWIDNHGWELNPTLRTNWALPGLNDRLKLVVNEVHSSGSVGGAGADDDPTAALRWAGPSGKSKNNGYSLDFGLSGYGDPSAQVFGRINAYRRWGIGLWNLRLQNRLFYYATSELRNDFRIYVERPVTDRLFLDLVRASTTPRRKTRNGTPARLSPCFRRSMTGRRSHGKPMQTRFFRRTQCSTRMNF